MSLLIANITYSLRILRKHRILAFVAIISISLGIGALVVSIAELRALVINVYPYENLNRLVFIGPRSKWQNNAIAATSIPNFADIKRMADSYSEIGFTIQTTKTLGLADDSERIPAMLVTPSMFTMTGMRTAFGRVFDEEDIRRGRTDLALISYSSWESDFGGDKAILGRVIQLDRKPYRVVGVLSKDMYILMKSYKIYIPFSIDPSQLAESHRNSWEGTVFGLLKPSSTLASAQSELNTIRRKIIESHPEYLKLWNDAETKVDFAVDTIRHNSFRFGGLSIIPTACYSIISTALFLLIICGLNLSTITLSLTHSRASEMAIRSSLGATPRKLFAQIVTENAIIYLLGGLVGAVFAFWGIASVRAASDSIIIGGQLRLDSFDVAIALVTSLLFGIVFGLIPASLLRHGQRSSMNQNSTRNVSYSRRTMRSLGVFISAEVCLTFILLFMTGMMIQTVRNVLAASPGFDAKHLLAVKVNFPVDDYPEATLRSRIDAALGALSTLPGVEQAAVSASVPFASGLNITAVNIPGRSEAAIDMRTYEVSAGYMEALSIPLKEGRYLATSDVHGSESVAVIDSITEKRLFNEHNSIGERVSANGKLYAIVGVVEYVKHGDIREPPIACSIYFSINQNVAPHNAIFVLKTSREANSLVQAINRVFSNLDPKLARADISSIQEIIDGVAGRREMLILKILEGFSIIAVFVSIIGTYGLVSFFVSQSTREIGIRVAIGAQPKNVISLILSRTMRYPSVGLLLGIIGAILMGKLAMGMFYGINSARFGDILSVAALLLLISFIACLVPLFRALRLRPVDILRVDST